MSFLATNRRCPPLEMLLILALISLASRGQTPRPLSSGTRSAGNIEQSEITREIDDPSSGGHWLLVQNADHPGGPGRLFLVNRDAPSELPAILGHYPPARALVPVIRAGDALIVEEHTKVVDARFEGIALGPARTGETFRIRVRLGGTVLRAVATGSGHAVLEPSTGTRP